MVIDMLGNELRRSAGRRRPGIPQTLLRTDYRYRTLERGSLGGSEQGVDQLLQTQMLRDGYGKPGTAVLLTGDGRGFSEGAGFHADLERMRVRGWRIEVVSWRHSCARRMREWAIEHGVFIALDDYYESVTFLESPPPGHLVAAPRFVKSLDLNHRPRA